MRKVAITGGIGCGKSTVLAEFRRIGVPCFEADATAAAYYNDSAFLAQVRCMFGDEVFLPDGSADKRKIAQLVFSDKAALAGLNAIVHPRVMADFGRFCAVHEAERYVLFESAIVYESGLDRAMDCVVCVYLDREERLARLKLRDHATEEQLLARMANQLPAEDVMLKADYVILNYEGNPRKRQVEWIDQKLKR